MPQGPPVRAGWPWLPSPTQLAWYRWTLMTPKPKKSPTERFAVLTALCITWMVYSLQGQLIQEISGGASLHGIFVGYFIEQSSLKTPVLVPEAILHVWAEKQLHRQHLGTRGRRKSSGPSQTDDSKTRGGGQSLNMPSRKLRHQTHLRTADSTPWFSKSVMRRASVSRGTWGPILDTLNLSLGVTVWEAQIPRP